MSLGIDQPANEAELKITPSRLFTPWLASQKASLAFTTYQAGKIFFIGVNREDSKLSIFERTFPRPMGIGADGDRIWLSSLYQVWRFQNFLEAGETYNGYDAVFVPIEGRTTGDVDIHDVHPQATGPYPVFVVTRFNCLATFDDRNSFKPIWKPPFIDRILSEDRCHLNGLAVADGHPRFVTCVAATNQEGAWRQHRESGGVVIDVDSGEIVASNLSMPHSPRLFRDKLFIIQSGTGEFGQIDLASGRFEPVCALPGFARGVTFMGNHAVIGVSRPRPDRTFEGLALFDRLKQQKIEPLCQLAVVNMTTGAIEHTVDFSGAVQELYDVTALAGTIRPMALGFKTDEIRFTIRPGELAETE